MAFGPSLKPHPDEGETRIKYLEKAMREMFDPENRRWYRGDAYVRALCDMSLTVAASKQIEDADLEPLPHIMGAVSPMTLRVLNPVLARAQNLSFEMFTVRAVAKLNGCVFLA